MFSLVSGFLRWAVARDEAKILVVGLSESGKTTLLEQVKGAYLRGHRLAPPGTIPATLGMNLCKIGVQDMDVTLWDVGGSMRKIWPQYYGEADGVVFVVDASARGRFGAASEALLEILTNTATCPILVLANKQDSPQAARASEVVEEVCKPAGLGGKDASGGRAFRVMEIAALKGGAGEAKEVMEWIVKEARSGALERQ
jgi:small GTP-binding protein